MEGDASHADLPQMHPLVARDRGTVNCRRGRDGHEARHCQSAMCFISRLTVFYFFSVVVVEAESKECAPQKGLGGNGKT